MRRRGFCALLGGVALAPWGARWLRADPAPACSSAPADEALLDAAALCRMIERRAKDPAARLHSVLVMRRGRLLFERYFAGSEEVPGRLFGTRTEEMAFGPETRHAMKSVSKSVASLVVGIAVDKGLVGDLDRPILDLFPELSDLHSPERDRIRLVDALTMTMGLAWEEATPATGSFANDEARMNMAWSPERHVLSRAVTAPAGQAFVYNTGALRLVSAIVHRAVGRPLDDVARTELFEPLGIAAEWARVRGETDAGGGLRLTPRDMLKIGQLVLDRGLWQGRRIVSASWIDRSTAAHIPATDGLSYGYLWWTGQVRQAGRDFAWIGALGRGGQSIRIVRELDLVVAVTAGSYQDYSPEAFRAQYGVFTDVLRAVRI